MEILRVKCFRVCQTLFSFNPRCKNWKNDSWISKFLRLNYGRLFFNANSEMSSEHQYFKDRGKIIILCKEDEFYRKKKKIVFRDI